MKLDIDQSRSQGDPYVIRAHGAYYMYATHEEGVQLYKSADKHHWDYLGLCFQKEGEMDYWAPAVIEENGVFYMYYSSRPKEVHAERLCVASAPTPEGPFTFIRQMAPSFSIDPHAVKSGDSLYMFYSVNDEEAERVGTLIVVDKMLSPTHLAGNPTVVVRATLDEEIFMRDRFAVGTHWHTIEGAFYLQKDGWHYLMYSGSCYQNEHYFIGYATCRSDETDLTKLSFQKYPNEQTYAPLVCKNDEEEGTGHHSVLEEDGTYTLFYHGRDVGDERLRDDTRTARSCRLHIEDGVLTVLDR